MKPALQNYHARMQRVLDYIDRHLGSDLDLDLGLDLDLETLSGVAALFEVCQRLSFFPEVPEHEAVADLFLPLK